MACLVSCSQCSRPHARDERACPFCRADNTGVRYRGGLLAAVAMGLALGGCVDDGEEPSVETMTTSSDGVESDSAGEATYGVPITEDGDSSSTSGSDTDIGGSSTGAPDTDTDTDTDSDASTTGPAGTDTDTDTDGGTSSSSTSG